MLLLAEALVGGDVDERRRRRDGPQRLEQMRRVEHVRLERLHRMLGAVAHVDDSGEVHDRVRPPGGQPLLRRGGRPAHLAGYRNDLLPRAPAPRPDACRESRMLR